MSIKYTYKDVQTDVDSDHIRLSTQGKYLEDNIEIEVEGGGISAVLTVTNCYPSTTVTASDGTHTYNATANSSGVAEISIDASGEYTITAQYKYAYSTVNITASGSYSLYVHNVPSTHQEVQYIESTGTQYIDTAIVPTNDFEVIADITPTYIQPTTTTTTSGQGWGVGAVYQNISGGQRCYMPWIFTTRGAYAYSINFGSIDDSYTTSSDLGIRQDARHLIDAHYTTSRQKLTVDGVEKYNKSKSTTLSITDSFPLFAQVSNGTPSIFLKSRLYSCSILTNLELARLFTPCYDKSTGTAGLWDAVSETLFTNQGTGEFICGVPVNSLPEGYTQVEYIECTGTQYLNDAIPNANIDEIDADFTFKSTANSMPFGARGSDVYYYKYFAFWNSQKLELTLDNGNVYGTVTSATLAINVKHHFDSIIRNGLQKLSIDGTSIGSKSIALTQSSHQYPMYLFAYYFNGSFGNYFIGLTHSLKLKLNGNLVRDYIPCINANDEVGLYDVVTNQFFGNAGTGVFVAGGAI